MAQQSSDPGFGQSYKHPTRRLINKDGTFNVVRKGAGGSMANAYHFLVGLSLWRFLLMVLGTYLLVNCLFAFAYIALGVEEISGATPGSFWENFLTCFFFSVQTFTTVGYGAMSPIGMGTSLVASLEALAGLLSFALSSGLIYGRFSKPRSRLLFSNNALIAPYKDGLSLQFRIANMHSNVLMELEATVLVAFTNSESGDYIKKYFNLVLETRRVQFLPLNWTIVHPINEDSPLYGLTPKECERQAMELLIQIKSFDDYFSQTVHTRFSYLYPELIWGGKFIRPYAPNEEGDIVLDLEAIHSFEKVKIGEKLTHSVSTRT